MKTHVKALVVGGGAVGTSVAYHLGKAGWDTLLLERDELTSGSTWHAAGLLPYFNMSYATTHIHDYSIKFYKTLEEETGLNAGFSIVGNLRMAQTKARKGPGSTGSPSNGNGRSMAMNGPALNGASLSPRWWKRGAIWWLPTSRPLSPPNMS